MIHTDNLPIKMVSASEKRALYIGLCISQIRQVWCARHNPAIKDIIRRLVRVIRGHRAALADRRQDYVQRWERAA